MSATTLDVRDSSGSVQSLSCAQDAGNSSALVPLHAPAAATTGGASAFTNSAVAGTKVEVKSSQGVLFAASLLNTTAAVAYLQIFLKAAASVTVGSTTPDYVIGLAADGTAQVTFPVPLGTSAGTGITLAGTTAAGGSTGAAICVSLAYA